MSYNPDEYFHSGEFKAVLKKFEDAERHGKRILLDPEDYVDIAEYYYNNGDIDRACEIVDRTTEIYPGVAAPLLFKARMALLDYNDTEEADYYAELIEDKTDLEYYYIKAEIMITDNRAEEADAYLEECFALTDEEDKDYFAIDSAAIFLDYALPDRAEKWLARSEETTSVEYKEQYARLMLEQGEYETSKKLFNELIDKDPYSTLYWNSLASSQFLCHDIEGSIRSSEYSIAINPDNPKALFNKANGLYHLGNYKEAIVFYEKYNRLCPDDDNSEMLTGFCYIALEDFGNAVQHLEKAAALSKKNSTNISEIYKEWAYALCRLDRTDESMAVIDKAEDAGCDKNMLLVYRGSILYEKGNIEKGNECFINAIERSDGSLDVTMNVAIALFEGRNIRAAYKIFDLMSSKNLLPEKGFVYLAACCYELNKKEEFLYNLKKAVKYYPDETKVLLGQLFPEDMEVDNYYRYMYEKINNKNDNAI